MGVVFCGCSDSLESSALSNPPEQLTPSQKNTGHLTPGGSRLSRTSSTASSLRDRFSSPDRKSRRPSATRRPSTAFQPHKGWVSSKNPLVLCTAKGVKRKLTSLGLDRQEFSVDDETNEVEVDQEYRQRGQGSTGYAAMRRHSQLLRRRNTQSTVLSNVDSTDDEGTETPDTGVPIEEQSGDDDGEEEDEEEEVDEGTVKADEYEPSEADSVESFTLKVSSNSTL